jgi:hypothetical protein
VQGPTTELVEIAADRLAAELRTVDGRFSSVRRLEGSEFLQRSALLFPPVDQVTDNAGRLTAAKPMIEMLAVDPSLRGVMHALTFGIGAVQARHMPPDALVGPMNMLSDTLDDLFAGRFPSFSWRALMNGKPAAPDEPRGLIQIKPKLDFSALEPGRAASTPIPSNAAFIRLRSAEKTLSSPAAGSDDGGENWALLASLIETCKLNRSIRKPGLPTCSPSSSTTGPTIGSRNSCPGPGAPPRKPNCQAQSAGCSSTAYFLRAPGAVEKTGACYQHSDACGAANGPRDNQRRHSCIHAALLSSVRRGPARCSAASRSSPRKSAICSLRV